METLFIGLRTLFYTTGFFCLFGWLALRVATLDRTLRIALPAWGKWPGLLLMGTGAALVLACAGVFVERGRGTPAVFDPPRQFVASGPYKFVRNPMYLGGLAVLGGFGLSQRSLSILLLALALFGLVHQFVLFVEEPGLEKRFGQSYFAYKQCVNRWLPTFR